VKTIIAGSRSIDDYALVSQAIKEAGFPITEVVSGGARGVDALGEQYGRENNIPIKVFPADWETYGKAAGSIRNKVMSEYGEALIAIWDGISSGTADMIRQAEQKNLQVCVIRLSRSQIMKESPRIPWNME
jgi:hypothetical protein